MTEITAPAASRIAPSALLEGLVEELSTSGALTPQWRAAFLAVPRHLFVPNLVWCEDHNGRGPHPLRRADQPDTWLQMVYRDEPVITQINDGAPAAGHSVYTSAASMPSVVAETLTALRAEPGMRVLEIGTGTGWNAALLAYGSATSTSPR